MAAYLPCAGGAPRSWTVVSSILAPFLGSFDVPFGAGQACNYPVPLGLQLARLLAIGATLSGATPVHLAVSRSRLAPPFAAEQDARETSDLAASSLAAVREARPTTRASPYANPSNELLLSWHRSGGLWPGRPGTCPCSGDQPRD